MDVIQLQPSVVIGHIPLIEVCVDVDVERGSRFADDGLRDLWVPGAAEGSSAKAVVDSVRVLLGGRALQRKAGGNLDINDYDIWYKKLVKFIDKF